MAKDDTKCRYTLAWLFSQHKKGPGVHLEPFTSTLYSVIKDWASHCLIPEKTEGDLFKLEIGSRTKSNKKRLVNLCKGERRYNSLNKY